MSAPNPMSERNQRVIEDFRAHAGQIADGRPVVLLTTTGRKSGRPYTTPVMFRREGDRIAVFASKGGAPTDPDWYLNLVANPTVTIEVGPERYEARAIIAQGAERDAIFARQGAEFPQFAEYQTKTTRKIPVVLLERQG